MRTLSAGFAGLTAIVFAACAAPPAQSPAPATQAPSGAFSEKELEARYYYDLGPDSIDVSQYPLGQQENYKLFAQVCSRCHTLARAINSPRETYIAWKFYVFTMRMRSKLTSSAEYTPEEAQRIVDFLTYDSMVRKDIHREEYEALRKRLEARYDEVLSEHMRRLFQALPKPRRSLDPHR